MILSLSFGQGYFVRILFILLLSGLCVIAGRTWSAPLRVDEAIRVALIKGAETVRIDGDGVLAIDEKGLPLRLTFPLALKRNGTGVGVNGRSVKVLKVTAPGTLIVNGKGYRGKVEVSAADKGLLVVNELPLEEYLVGLINCEISSQWPIEAVKAQAVIARTYALYQKANRRGQLFHLESTVLDQVYDGCDLEDSRAARGVHETAGEVLTFDGAIIQAFYHSSCGGHTETADNVWGVSLPYLKSVTCKYCLSAPSVRWEQVVPLQKIEGLLKLSGLREVRAAERTARGRVQTLELLTSRGTTRISGAKFRQAVGYGVIRSTNFFVRTVGDDVVFSGIGSGHGVGLCQWGAKERAAEGFDYREILSYYYPGTRLQQRLAR
jgi:stage II sporulation protein D